MTRYFDLPRPRLFGHRGAAADFPENTLPSFAAAVAAGVPYLELDVWATADGQVVVHHDETLLRTCGVEKRLSDLTLFDVQQLDAGCNFTSDEGRSYPFRGQGIAVPTLTEVLTAYPEARFNIEIKQDFPAIEELVVTTVREAGKEDRVLLAAEKDGVMEKIRSVCGEIPTSLSASELQAFFTWAWTGASGAYTPPGRALQIPPAYGEHVLVTAETVAIAHCLGLEIHVWTVNEPDEMRRLLDLGVDGLMSDRPDILDAVARERARGGMI